MRPYTLTDKLNFLIGIDCLFHIQPLLSRHFIITLTILCYGITLVFTKAKYYELLLKFKPIDLHSLLGEHSLITDISDIT